MIIIKLTYQNDSVDADTSVLAETHNTLQYAATQRYNLLQHSDATCCNTLKQLAGYHTGGGDRCQHLNLAATHCNTTQ